MKHPTNPKDRPQVLAFYLPQFHPIPENNEWWGEGFTEWTNVKKTKPLFQGHYQPQVPASELGYYDLRDIEIARKQSELAVAHGITAFVYYHYWFDGKRLLETPLDLRLASDIEMPFAICWANENWTRRWDGKAHEVLLQQRYGSSTADEVFRSLLPYLRDDRYLRADGRLVVLVHRADHIPSVREFIARWRNLAASEGLPELYLLAAETAPGYDATSDGFDAIAEFPPVGDSTIRNMRLRNPHGLPRNFSGRLNSYTKTASSYIQRYRDAGSSSDETRRHPGVIPRWDNSPRRGLNATIFTDASPGAYANWLAAALDFESASPRPRMVFINAWNEWAEGAYLEPDTKFGDAYLRATHNPHDFDESSPEPLRGYRVSLRRVALSLAGSIKPRVISIRTAIRRRLGRR